MVCRLACQAASGAGLRKQRYWIGVFHAPANDFLRKKMNGCVVSSTTPQGIIESSVACLILVTCLGTSLNLLFPQKLRRVQKPFPDWACVCVCVFGFSVYVCAKVHV